MSAPSTKSRVPALSDRSSGVLLHLTSLPGPHGVGDLGATAHRFAEFLAGAGQSWWQMLPVGPPGFGDCPYMALSAFAGSADFLSLDALQEEGLLARGELAAAPRPAGGRVRYAEARRFREPLLRRASREFFRRGLPEDLARYEAFCAAHAAWLDDFALYDALRHEAGGRAWTAWPADVRDRRGPATARAGERLEEEVRYRRFLQYVFFKQWSALRDRCRVLGIGLIGDVPIYVAHESADVWGNRDAFRLEPDGRAAFVAGVPPDYFSATGQRWGHPLFDWERMRETGYAWWLARLARAFGLFDAVRLDHFIGFRRYWEIPASCPTAVEGRWVEGPGEAFFEAVLSELGEVPIIAEDLGAVTPEVTALRRRFGFPGMRVLQFAFGGDPRTNDHLPHRHERAGVVYPGTHDNDTLAGWYRELNRRAGQKDAEAIRERAHLHRYLGSDGREIHWEMIRLAMSSVADLCILPMQDLLGLGSDARMNRPSTAEGNWDWRMEEGSAGAATAARLRDLTESFGRLLRGAD